LAGWFNLSAFWYWRKCSLCMYEIPVNIVNKYGIIVIGKYFKKF